MNFGSVNTATKPVDRDYREGHHDLTELEDLGLSHVEGGGPGTAKTPVIAYDDIEVAIPLASGESEPATP